MAGVRDTLPTVDELLGPPTTAECRAECPPSWAPLAAVEAGIIAVVAVVLIARRRAVAVRVKLPGALATFITSGAVAAVAFLNLELYQPRLGFIWNVLNQDIDLGSYVVPYRYFLVACVMAATGRLLWRRPDGK